MSLRWNLHSGTALRRSPYSKAFVDRKEDSVWSAVLHNLQNCKTYGDDLHTYRKMLNTSCTSRSDSYNLASVFSKRLERRSAESCQKATD